MGTETKEPQAAETISNVVDRILADSAALMEAAEEILWKLQPDEPLTAAERNVLRIAGFIEWGDVERERSRVAIVKRTMEQAGPAEDFREALRMLDSATKAEQSRRSELVAQIETLQAELESLEQTRLAAAKTVSELEAARANLRNPRILPKHIREEYEATCEKIRTNVDGRRVRELIGEITAIEGLNQIDVSTPGGIKAAELHCETAAPELIQTETHGPPEGNQWTTTRIQPEDFIAYRKNRRKELPKLQRELDELNAEQSNALALSEEQLNFYVSRL